MQMIGPYKICGLLGRGGMSKVYKVTMPTIGKIVALKRLDPDPMLAVLMGAETVRRRFVAEAVTMAGLRHPNILDVIGYGEIDGTPCYLMDYFCHDLGTLIGETYRIEAPSRIIRIDRAVGWTRDILRGLSRLHHAGIVHRDIKPFNIMLTDQGVARIGDFGLSKLRGETTGNPDNLKVGTPFYAAPEQEADPDRVTPAADLFAVGVILYRMLTGRLAEGTFRPASGLNPDVNAAWDDFFDRALAPEPEQRFQNADAMGRELDRLYGQWERETDGTCRFPAMSQPREHNPDPDANGLLPPLRSAPVRIRPREAPGLFHTDSLWRPRHYIANRFADNRDGTVTDGATGLTWQQSGAPYPLSWARARQSIETLNRTRMAGRDNWRLPTVAELISLVARTPHGADFCMEPVFDPVQKWLWSADRRSYTAAYYVNMEMGFVAWHDFTGYYYVKGVCTDPVP